MKKQPLIIPSQSDILRVPTVERLNRRSPSNDKRIRRAVQQGEELIGDILTPVRQRCEKFRTNSASGLLCTTTIEPNERYALESNAIQDVIKLELRSWQSKKTLGKIRSKKHDLRKHKRMRRLWKSETIERIYQRLLMKCQETGEPEEIAMEKLPSKVAVEIQQDPLIVNNDPTLKHFWKRALDRVISVQAIYSLSGQLGEAFPLDVPPIKELEKYSDRTGFFAAYPGENRIIVWSKGLWTWVAAVAGEKIPVVIGSVFKGRPYGQDRVLLRKARTVLYNGLGHELRHMAQQGHPKVKEIFPKQHTLGQALNQRIETIPSTAKATRQVENLWMLFFCEYAAYRDTGTPLSETLGDAILQSLRISLRRFAEDYQSCAESSGISEVLGAIKRNRQIGLESLVKWVGEWKDLSVHDRCARLGESSDVK